VTFVARAGDFVVFAFFVAFNLLHEVYDEVEHLHLHWVVYLVLN